MPVHVHTADRAGRSLAISLRSLPRVRAFAPSTRRIHHCLYPPRDPPSAIELTRRLTLAVARVQWRGHDRSEIVSESNIALPASAPKSRRLSIRECVKYLFSLLPFFPLPLSLTARIKCDGNRKYLFITRLVFSENLFLSTLCQSV